VVRDLLASSAPDTIWSPLAPSVAFHSPVAVPRPQRRCTPAHHHRLVLVRSRAGERWAVERRRLEEFTARVGDHPVDGVLIRRAGPEGLIEEATLFLRPLGALHVAVTAMRDALRDGPIPLPSRR
jgi:hypothetical protein